MKTALNDFFSSNYPRLLNFTGSTLNVHGVENAEDVLTDAYIKATTSDKLPEIKNIDRWFYSILRSCATDFHRKRKLKNTLMFEAGLVEREEDPIGSTEHLVTNSRMADKMVEEMQNYDNASILFAVLAEGHSYLKVARDSGVSQAACRKMVQRFREDMKEKYCG